MRQVCQYAGIQMGYRPSAAALSVPRLPANLQCADRHAAGAAAPQIDVAWLLRGVATDAQRAQVGQGLRGCAEHGVSRHRFLTAPAARKPAQLCGIVEADETFFRRSYKGSRRWTTPVPGTPPPSRAARRRGAPTGKRGTPLDQQVPVLIMRDRQKVTSDAVLDNLTAQAIGEHLIPRLAADALLCTDTGRAYGVIARQAGIRQEPVNISAGEYVRDGVFHIQNVNAYDSRLKAWMQPFRGVATRYLHNYLGWRRMIERLAETINPDAILLNCAASR